MNNKVSIIVPIYNTQQYLRKCLDSLVNQTLKDIEIICINDGSTDDSQRIVDEYTKKYANVKSYIKENGGISSVRNYGIKLAQGEYIGFVDSDDYVELDMYEKLYKFATSKDLNVAVCAYYLDEGNKQTIYKEYHYQDTREMLTRFYGVLWNKIYKKTFIDSLDFDFPLGKRFEDSYYLAHMALYIDKIDFLDDALIHYVMHFNSLTNTRSKTTLDAIDMMNCLRKYYQDKDAEADYYYELEYVFIRFSLGNPFVTASKIKDSKDRKFALESLWEHLIANYPDFKNNPYLVTLPGLKNRYFKMMNKSLYKLSSFIQRFI